MKKVPPLLIAGLMATNIAMANDYESMSACEKEDNLWQSIIESEYRELPNWSGFEVFNLFRFTLPWRKNDGEEFFGVTMNRKSDVMPEGRKKHIHTYGSVVPVRFVAPPDTPYTGIFTGTECGLARLSLAAKPGDTTTPGMAVKLLVDGHPSMNFVAMNSLEGQTSYNFFEKTFTNFISAPDSAPLKLLAKAFALVSDDPTKIDVSYMANINEHGQRLSPDYANGPGQIFLTPNEQLTFDSNEHEVRNDLATIAAGTKLYDIYTLDEDGNRIEIGYIESKNRFVASKFGDENLFFRHEAIDQHR